MHWDAVGFPLSLHLSLHSRVFKTVTDDTFRLAYCEIYVTLGTLFRRYQTLKAMPLSEEDLQFEDYFAPYRPVLAKKFRVKV